MKFIVIKIGGSTLSDMHPSLLTTLSIYDQTTSTPLSFTAVAHLLMKHYQTSKSSHTLLMA